MRTSRIARPPHVGRGWSLLWLVCLIALLAGCGGGSYAKAAHSPGAQERASAGGATRVETLTSGGGYDDEMVPAAEPAAPMPAEPMPAAPMPADRPVFADRPISGKLAQAEGTVAEKPAKAAPPASSDPHGTKPQEPEIATDAVPIEQVLIYTAQFRMAVFEVDEALDDVEALARSLGGFLSRRTDTEITIRVPAAQFDDALNGIAAKGDVLTRNVQVEDVTEEYLDVTLRLKNARQVRERIAQLLADAKSVEESLEVERELNRLSGEIERLEGRLKFLRNRARYSTITVTFQPERVDEVPSSAFQLPFPWLRELGLGRLMNLR